MIIEIAAPCVLPLGLVRRPAEGKTILVGITLQHPPTDLYVKAGPHPPVVTGARAALGWEMAQQICRNRGLEAGSEIEIELAIPQHMGLGSEGILGLSLARGLAAFHGQPVDDVWHLARTAGLGPRRALDVWAFDRGGLLLVEAEGESPGVLERREIRHPENEAWAFVMYFPRPRQGLPDDFELRRLNDVLDTAPQVSVRSAECADRLLLAVERDDLAAFGQAVMELQRFTREAQAAAGRPAEIAPEEETILNLMCENGAVGWGRSLTGLTLFGLIRGGEASRHLRKKLSDQVGFFGGVVMAAICDNQGAVTKTGEGDWMMPPPILDA